MPDTRIAAIVALLLVAGSVAGFLVTDDSLSEGLGLAPAASSTSAGDGGCSVPAEFSFPSGAQVETWSGDVPADADGGDLEVRSYHGGVDVATWDEAGYQVEVAEVDDGDALEPRVEAGTAGGSFSLLVTVENTNGREAGPFSGSVAVGDSPEAHVKVRVPSAAYDALEVDDHPDENASLRIDGDPSVDPENGSVEFDDSRDERPLLVDGVEAATLTADAHDRGIRVADVAADDAKLGTHDGSVCASAAEAGSLAAESHDGNLHLSDVTADEAVLGTHDGDLHLSAVAADQARLDTHDGAIAAEVRTANLTAESHAGPVDVALTPTDSGSATVDTHDGDVELAVPAGDAYGYDATADTHDGDVTIRLPNAVVDDSGGHDGEDDGVHARTQGFETRDIQVQLTAGSHSGDVTIAGR